MLESIRQICRSSKRETSPCAHSTDSRDAHAAIQGLNRHIDDVVKAVFQDWREELLAQPLLSVVQGVWGQVGEGKSLSPMQRAIHARTLAALTKIRQTAGTALPPEGSPAADFLIRNLIVFKIGYMVEAAKNGICRQKIQEKNVADMLNQIEPFGHA